MSFLNGVDLGLQMCSIYIEGTDHDMSKRTEIRNRLLGIFNMYSCIAKYTVGHTKTVL